MPGFFVKRYRGPEDRKGRTSSAGRPFAAGVVLLILLALSTFACSPDDVANLHAEQLKKMLAADTKPVVVDTRSEAEYLQGHVPGAILISQEKVEIADRFLPGDKDAVIVFYCRGAG